LEIDVKTIVSGTFCIVCEKHLEEKAANEAVQEFDVFFDNRYIACGTHNNQVLSHPCGNKLMKEDVLYDGIEDLYTFLVEGSSSIVNVPKRGKKRIFSCDIN